MMPSIGLQRIKDYTLREKAVLLLPLLAVWCGLTLSTQWRPTWDSAMYIAMGESIINGDGARYMGYGGIKYPPGFPFMLGLIIGPFGHNFLLMRIFIVGCAVGSAWLAYLIVRDRSDRWLATAVMCATVSSYALIFECTRILADLPYMFLSLLALRWVERYAKDAKSWHGKIGYIAIALIVAAYFTRIVGLTLFAGTIAYLTLGGAGARVSWTNLKKALAVGIVLITVPTIWTVQNQLRGPSLPSELREALSYEREFLSKGTNTADAPRIGWNDLVFRLRINSEYYEQLVSNILLGRRLESRALIHGAMLFLIIGYIHGLARQRGVYEYYVPIYLLIYMLWTTRQGERFLVPIIPLLLYYAFRALALVLKGLQQLVKRATGWEDRSSILGALGAIALIGIFFQWNWTMNVETIQREHRRPYHDEHVARIIEFAGWLKTNTPPETIIVSDQPAYVHLFSDRKTFGFPWLYEPDAVLDSIRNTGADYVISMPSIRSKRHLHPMLAAHSAHFEVVHRQGQFAILRLRRDRSSG